MYTDIQVNQSQLFTDLPYTIGSEAQAHVWGREVNNYEIDARIHQEKNGSLLHPSTTITRYVEPCEDANNSFFQLSTSAIPTVDTWGAGPISTFPSEKPIKQYTQSSNVIDNDGVWCEDRIESVKEGNMQSTFSHTEPSIQQNAVSIMSNQPSKMSQSVITGSDYNKKPKRLSTAELLKMRQMCEDLFIDKEQLLKTTFEDPKYVKYMPLLETYCEDNIVTHILQPDLPIFTDEEKGILEEFLSCMQRSLDCKISIIRSKEMDKRIKDKFVSINILEGIKVNDQEIKKEQVRGKSCVKQARHEKNKMVETLLLESKLSRDEIKYAKQNSKPSYKNKIDIIIKKLESIADENDIHYSNIFDKYDFNILAALIACNNVKKLIPKTLDSSDIPKFTELRNKVKNYCGHLDFKLKKKLYDDELKRLIKRKGSSTVTLGNSNCPPIQNEFSLIKPIHSLVNHESSYSNCISDEEQSSESNTAKAGSDMIFNSTMTIEISSQNTNPASQACDDINESFKDYYHSEYIDDTKTNTKNSDAYLDLTSSENYLPDILKLPTGKSLDPIKHNRKRLASGIGKPSFGELKKILTEEKAGFKLPSEKPNEKYTQVRNVIENTWGRDEGRIENLKKGPIKSNWSNTEPSIEKNGWPIMLNQPSSRNSNISQSIITGSYHNNVPIKLTRDELREIGRNCKVEDLVFNEKKIIRRVFHNHSFKKKYSDIIENYGESKLVTHILQPEKSVFNDVATPSLDEFFSNAKKSFKARVARIQGREICKKIENKFVLTNNLNGITVNDQDIKKAQDDGKLFLRKRRYRENSKLTNHY